MTPGATTWPVASITRAASPPSPGPTTAMRSPSIATSARCPGAPVPSMTVPPRISRDQATGLLLDDRHRLYPIARLDAIDVIHAGDHLTEDRVVAVEVGLRPIGDVELAAGGVGVLATRHGHGAPRVLARVELGLDRVPGAAGAVALGVAALHDEVGHHPVEGETVVEALLGQRHEVLNGPGGVRSEEHTSELQSLAYLVCRLLLEKKKKNDVRNIIY